MSLPARPVVQAALEEIMAKLKRTTVTIAHRLSTIRNCDVIAVVNKGQIVEKGIYDELVALGGLFHGLATKQLKVAVEVDAHLRHRHTGTHTGTHAFTRNAPAFTTHRHMRSPHKRTRARALAHTHTMRLLCDRHATARVIAIRLSVIAMRLPT
eukprot:6987766-Prymnesium_polylepis.1